ncbi:hypothetical protein [Paenibacillus sp. NRS-1760]|uniref:hypothetical protein n=1 Tax=Paenibacillus sp. NRS-1760 TaxID=3233902 RepID=UPI003D278706
MPIIAERSSPMDFTEGRRRQYEQLMKEKPGFTQSCPSEEKERPIRKQEKGTVTKPKQTNRKRCRED